MSTAQATDVVTRFLDDLARRDLRIAGVDPEISPCVTEQTASAELGESGIAWMNLVCSGDRPFSA